MGFTNRQAGENGRVGWLGLGISASLIGYLIWNCLYYYPSTIDDTFICFRYAANWLAGEGLVFNSGEHVEGFSNFLWVAITAGFMALGIPALAGLKILGLLSAVGVAVSTLVLGQRIFAEKREETGAALLAVGLLCLNTNLAYWSQAGLETVFYSFLLVASFLRFEIEMERERPLPISGALFALAWMTRPEAPIYGLYFLWRRGAALSVRPLGRSDALWLLVVAVLVGAYEFSGLWYYGSFLPNTHTAKVGGADLRFLSAIEGGRFANSLLARFATAQGIGFTALLVAGAAGCVIGRRRLPAAAWIPALGGLIFVAYAWRDWMPRYRFFVPILPFLFLMVSYGLFEIYGRLRRTSLRIAAAVVLVAALASYGNHQSFAAYRNAKGGIKPHAGEARGAWFLDVPSRVGRVVVPHEEEARALLRSVPEREVIAIGNLGFVGYATMNPLWDVYGLITPVVARARNGGASEEQAMFDNLVATRPGALLLYLPTGKHISMDVRIHDWMEAHPEFVAQYRREELTRGRIALYLRRDLAPVDESDRFASARSRLTHTGLDQPM